MAEEDVLDTWQARSIFERYSAAMAYVAVETISGDQGVGSAFHVGDGVFVTAKHVVEGNEILEVRSTERLHVELVGDEARHARIFLGPEKKPVHEVENGSLQILEGPFLGSNSDVAIFRVAKIDDRTPIIPLGGHIDDWIGGSDFVLWEAVILGYPPIPMSRQPSLVGARAEVNALVDLVDSPYVHFVVSAMPRGGFSGGPVIVSSESDDFALGMITRSLNSNYGTVESGYMAVLSIDSIRGLLEAHEMLPKCQELW